MCGIAGYISIHPHSQESLGEIGKSLLQRIRYRGPDDEGCSLIQGNEIHGALVHTRLSIIGLGMEGHQPMHSENGRFILSFNGEIFNYQELKTAFQLPVKSKTDTEVLLLMWERMGLDCLSLLDGFFAFAIWDTHREECYLVRDKTGVKPLYWRANQAGDCLFSSDERTLIFENSRMWNAHTIPGKWYPNINHQSPLDSVINSDYITHFRNGKSDTVSPYSHINQVPSAGYVKVKKRTSEKVDFSHDSELSIETSMWFDSSSNLCLEQMKEKTNENWKSLGHSWRAVDQLDEVLDKLPRVSTKAELLRRQLIISISRRMQSDVPIGFALSGGLDSSAIAAVATVINRSTGKSEIQSLNTFSIVSDGCSEDESKWQRMMVDYLGTRHHSVETTGFSHQSLNEFIQATGRPALHWNNLAHFELCKQVKKSGVTVLFNGQGADEIFAGYPSYYVHQLFNEWTYLIPRRNKWPLSFTDALKQAAKQKMLSWLGKDTDSRILLFQKLKNDYYGNRLNQLLRFEDRNGMANQLESRNPFADDFLLSQWIGLSAMDENFEENEGYLMGELSGRMYHGYSKGLLREAMVGLLPTEILERTDKKGFTVPHQSLTQQHYLGWEDAILGVEYLNKWWKYRDRKRLFQEGRNTEELFQCASLGYFVKYLESEFDLKSNLMNQ